MNLRKKRWMVTGAALAMVASLGLSACGGGSSSSSGGGQAANSETGKNEVTMASRTPNWIFPISAKGYTQGENGQFIQSMYRPLFAYKSTSDTPYKINLPKSLGTVPEVSEDGLTYTIKLRDDAEFNSVRSGAIDFGYIPAAQYNQRKAVEDKGYNVFLWPGNSITYLALNFAPQAPGSKFINQKYIRQALQQLIDQPTLSEKIWSGTASPTCGPVPMATDKVGTTEGCVYKFDPDAAKKLLEDHGWKVVPDGESTCENPGTGANQCGEGIAAGDKLSFKLVSQSGFVSTHQMFEELISQFGKLGIKIDMNEVPDSVGASQACDDETPCTWDMSFFGSQTSWGFPIYASGERLFATDAPVNLGQYSNPEADKLIEESTRSSEPDALQAYNDYLAEDLPVLWMPNPYYQITAVKKTLDLGELDATGDTWPEDWSWSTEGK